MENGAIPLCLHFLFLFYFWVTISSDSIYTNSIYACYIHPTGTASELYFIP